VHQQGRFEQDNTKYDFKELPAQDTPYFHIMQVIDDHPNQKVSVNY
jgi:hypothetical protein